MPNWCSTDFIVTGPVEEISRFREAVRGSDNNGETPFDFDRVIPMPSELNDTTADFGMAYDVYYGNAKPMLAHRWIKDLGSKRSSSCADISMPTPSTERPPTSIRRISKSMALRHGMNGVASIGVRSGTVMPK